MRLFLFVLILIFPFSGNAQPVRITGTAPGAEGRSVHLFVTKDFITFLEEEITKTIRDVSLGAARITILIAHRLSTIMHADRIYVLEKGLLSETGTHTELLEKKGLYYAMWRQQIGERV